MKSEKANPDAASGTNVRRAVAADEAALKALVDAVDLVPPHVLDDIIAAYAAGTLDRDHDWVVVGVDGLMGCGYVVPEPMTDGTWNLLFLGVHPDHRGRGFGAALVRYVERTLAARDDGRLLIIETSGLAGFERTRSFYRSLGYDEEARIRDYYAVGDDKIVFRKTLVH